MSSATPPRPLQVSGAAVGPSLHPQRDVLPFRKGVPDVSDGMGGAGGDEISGAQGPAGEVNSVLGSDRPLTGCVTLLRARNLLKLQFPYL